MNAASFVGQIGIDSPLYGDLYKIYVELATLLVLFYIGLTDFRTFKIRNDAVLLLLVLYGLMAFVARSWFEIFWNVLFASLMFLVLLWFYTRRVVGGGDVKFMTVVCLWIGGHCALPFSVLLLFFIGLHFCAAKMGWVRSRTMNDGLAIPYAPSVAAAVSVAIIFSGCV